MTWRLRAARIRLYTSTQTLCVLVRLWYLMAVMSYMVQQVLFRVDTLTSGQLGPWTRTQTRTWTRTGAD